MKQELLTTDILIIGGGIAGATAALVAAQKNPHVSVTILTRSTDTYESNTFYAQGGIIAKGGEDLFHDIMDSGTASAFHKLRGFLPTKDQRLFGPSWQVKSAFRLIQIDKNSLSLHWKAVTAKHGWQRLPMPPVDRLRKIL